MNSFPLFGPSAETLWNKNKRRKRTGLTSGSNLPPEILTKLGNAELHYINGETQQAIDILSLISRQAPKLAEPYNILGLIYEDSNDFLRALQLYALAATFTPKSVEVWKKVANMATILGEYEQAIAATKKCIKIEPEPSFYGNMIFLLLKTGRVKKAREMLRVLLNKYPGATDYLVEFGTTAEKFGLTDTALSAYLRFVFHWLGTDTIDNETLSSLVAFRCERKSGAEVVDNLDKMFFAVRKAVDLLLQRRDGLLPSVELINIIVECFQAVTASMPLDSAHNLPQFPSDLALLLGICQMRLGSEQDVETGLAILNPILLQLEADDTGVGVGAQAGAASSGDRLSSMMMADSDSEEEEDDLHAGLSETYTCATEDAAYSLAPECDDPQSVLSETSVFLLRQRIRVAEEFSAVGMLTRAEKLLMSVSARLKVLMASHAALSAATNASSGGTNMVDLDRVREAGASIGAMWRDVGNAYCALSGKEEQAYGAYSAALRFNDLDVEALSKYAELTRLHFPQNSKEVFGQLSAHFLGVITEFETLRSGTMEKPLTASSGTTTGSADNAPKSADTTAADTMAVVDEEEGEDPLEEQVVLGGSADPMDENAVLVGAGGRDADEEQEDGGNSKQLGSRGGPSESRQLDRSALQHEVFALVEWTYLFLEGGGDGSGDRDLLSYCSVVVPLLEHWCFKSSVAAGIIDSSVQKRRKKAKAVVSMGDLVATDSCLHYAPKDWLDATQNVCGRFVSALCDFVSVEKLLGKPLLMEMAAQATEFIALIGSVMAEEGDDVGARANETVMKQMSSELMHACTLMSLRRGCSQSRRRSRIGIAERDFSAVFAIDQDQEDEERRRREAMEAQGDEDDDDSDYVDDEAEEEDGGDNADIAGDKHKGRLNKLSTRKRKVQVVAPGPRVRRNARMANRHTGVKGGLMFNDFKNAAIIADNADPFVLTAKNYSVAVQNAATQLFKAPCDVVAANALFRGVVAESSMFESTAASKYIEVALPVARLRTVKQDSAVANLLAAHVAGLSRRLNDTLDLYLDAFCVDPTQPLTVLCVATYLLMLSNHSHIKHKHECLAKGLMFLHRYAEVRRKQPMAAVSVVDRVSVFVPSCGTSSSDGSAHHDFLTQLGMHQETLYNLGRAFHDIRLYSLAADQYMLALQIADANPVLARTDLCVTRETAHNLVLIYRKSGALDLALEVMERYLSYD